MHSFTQKPWNFVLEDPLLGRNEKPRENGLSMLIDSGLGIRETLDLVEMAGPYIDFVKLGFGTSMIYSKSILQNKIKLLRAHHIHVYPGGTLLETAVFQQRWQEFFEIAQKLGFSAIEVSDGTINLDLTLRKQLIQTARDYEFVVLSEVGKKESGFHLPVAEQVEMIKRDLDAGAFRVIIEGRESGKAVGIYEDNGTIRKDDLEKLVARLPDTDSIIWEAPLKSQQEELIARFGVNVNLGNLSPKDIISVESLRRGLRSDTLRLAIRDKIKTSLQDSSISLSATLFK